MHPHVAGAWAADRHAELLREADDWRRTHPTRSGGRHRVRRLVRTRLTAAFATVPTRSPGRGTVLREEAGDVRC